MSFENQNTKNMKNYKQLLFLLALINFFAFDALGQTNVITRKEAKTLIKDVKKETKRIKKSGFAPLLGEQTVERQLTKSYEKALQEDENGYSRYIVGNAQVVSQSQAGAKISAEELIRLSISARIQSNFTAILETQLANEQINASEAATIQKTVAASKNIISTKLGRQVILTEFYSRNDKNKTWEIVLRVGYDEKMAQKMAVNALKKQLKEEASELADQLDDILDLSNNDN